MRTESEQTASVTFAENRARGAVKFGVRTQDGVTRRGDLHESGSLRVRFHAVTTQWTLQFNQARLRPSRSFGPATMRLSEK